MAIQKGNVLIILYHFIFGKRADIIKGIKAEIKNVYVTKGR